MKYNKYYIPHHRLAVLMVIFDVLVVAAMHEITAYFVEKTKDISFTLSKNIGEGIFILVVLSLIMIIAALVICAAVAATEAFCRPVKFTQQGVECGFLLKDRISWESITEVCKAPLMVYREDIPIPADCVCIVCGSFSRSLLTKAGAGEIRVLIFCEKHLKRYNEWIKEKLYKIDEPVECPKMIIWLESSEELYRDIVTKWQETRQSQQQ